MWGADEEATDLEATLAFRVGEADERLRTRGRCHLVAGLIRDAVQPSRGARLGTSVQSLQTRFEVSGTDEAVAATLTAVARSLSTLGSDRLDAVAAEIARAWRPKEAWDDALVAVRFGSRGYGLGTLPLLGLGDIDPLLLDDWVHSCFNAANAVLWTNRRARIEPDLHALGGGEALPLPAPRQRDIAFPALTRGAEGRIALSLLGRFDATSRLGFGILADRIHTRCRTMDPSVPRPRLVTRRSGPGLATVDLAVDAAPAHLGPLRDGIAAELFDLAMAGPSDEELGRAQISLRRSRASTPQARRRLVEEVATEILYDEDLGVDAALHARPLDVAEGIRDASSRAVWSVPVDMSVTDHRLVEVAQTPIPVPDGEQFPATETSAAGALGPSLRIGSDVIGVDTAGITMYYADLVAVEAYPDGVRVLWNENGTTLRIDPRDWAGNARIGPLLDDRVDPWIVIHHDGPDDAHPGPERSGQRIADATDP